jgi:hypothetical protein
VTLSHEREEPSIRTDHDYERSDQQGTPKARRLRQFDAKHIMQYRTSQ